MKKIKSRILLGLTLFSMILLTSMMPINASEGIQINFSREQSRVEAVAETGASTLAELKQFYLTNSDDPVLISTVEEFIGYYEGDELFEKHLTSDPVDAIGMVKKVIDGAYLYRINDSEESPFSIQSTVAGVKLIQQKNNTWCGQCSILQVIYSYDEQDSVSGSTDDEKQETIADITGTPSAGISADAIEAALEEYVYGNYSYISCKNMSLSTFEDNLEESFDNGGAVILQTNPSYLSYYPSGQTKGHWIVAEGLTGGDTVKLVDCNYNDDYYGRHSESSSDVLDAVQGNTHGYIVYIP